MIIIFFGTPQFALPTLAALHLNHELKAVVTQPDKPKGRRLSIRPSATKEWAVQHSIPILEPESLRDPAFFNYLFELKPDVIVVAAYGKILHPDLLELPKFGCLNIHASLLPRYRGAAPIQRAIMDDMDVTGVTIMRMAAGMDTGDILDQAEVAIAPVDDAASLTAKLAAAGARLILETLNEIESGSLRPIKQNEALATYAPPLAKAESDIIWSWPAPRIVNLIRALSPAPGAYTGWRQKRLKIWKARSVPHETPQGEFGVHDKTLLVGAGWGAIEVLELQPEGKKVMGAAEFIHGYRPQSGEKVGDLV
ncbi:MAG: methionyl-tRNA formyltransferase [Actinomycetota bacterium]|nr:methionyl-tRNA formyltransferase [Actinomycetota bacterium]